MNIKLDEYQHKAVNTELNNVLIVAAPGSGKTTVIINRVLHLVNMIKVPQNQIVVITFTKNAANNMKRRYLKRNHSTQTPFFGTFHGLFYGILRRFIGNIKIISSLETHNIIRKVLLNYLDEINEDKIKEVLNSISVFKTGNTEMEYFKPQIDKAIFIECFNNYETYKKEKNLLDFDDLQIKCRDLFLQRPDVLNFYQKSFKYILVDEFQDCDELQLEILKLLNKDNSLFAVGDEDQCIYGFRGSKPECMVDFDQRFNGGKKLYLSLNYRSTENIVGLSKDLIKYNKMRNDKIIKAAREEKKEIKIIKRVNEISAAEEIAARIEKIKCLTEGKYSDNAILYRTNIESRTLVDMFIRKKIPFRLMDKEYNFFEHFICKDLIAYLKLSLDTADRESFARIINKPFRYVSKINLEKVKAFKYRHNCFDILCDIEGIPIYQIKTIKTLKKDINYLSKVHISSAVDFIITGIGYIDHLSAYSSKYKIDLSELEEVLEEFKQAAQEFKNIPAFLEHVEEVAIEIKNNSKKDKYDDDSVILSTIHGVKGMEFKNVYIINCVEEILPHVSNIESNIEEERRLMYVAVTRAINNLFMYVPVSLRGKTRDESRFIKECNVEIIEDASSDYKVGDQVNHSSYGKGKIIILKDNKVEIGFDDGNTRQFDMLILLNNNLIEKEAQ